MGVRQTLSLLVDGITIAGQIVVPDDLPAEGGPAVIFCHGIPATSLDASDGSYLGMAEAAAAEGFVSVAFNFRGCGFSGGNFDTTGWVHDLQAVVDYVAAAPYVDRSRIGLVGFSHGGVVSICVTATDPRIAALVACASPAESGKVFGEERLAASIAHFREIGIIKDPDFPLSLEQWMTDLSEISALRWVGRIAPRPLLIVHGSQDELVPVAQAHELYAAAGQPKELVVLEGTGHRLRRNPRTMEIAMRWLHAALVSAPK